MSDGKIRVNTEYVLGQLKRALAAASSNASDDDRKRADRKVERWSRVISGMLDASLDIGSRTPAKGAPAWATLEVVQGGFATGGLLAGGALRDHEIDLRNRLDNAENAGDDRTALNLYYLGDDGRRDLLEMLSSGRYRIDVPEEGALLVFAWLLDQGEADRAGMLIDEIAPFFDRLRFYPIAEERSSPAGATVRLQTIGETAEQIAATKPRPEIERMYQALTIWLPLYDRAVSLLLETVDGDPPSLKRFEDGALVHNTRGQPVVRGGWPCQHFPDGWRVSAQSVWREFRENTENPDKCGKPRLSIWELFGGLEKCLGDTSRLTGKDVGRLRIMIAAFVTKYGAPGSDRHSRLRAEQAGVAARPLHSALRKVLAARLGAFPADAGLDSVDPITAPTSPEEAQQHDVPPDSPMPGHYGRKLTRCLELPIRELVSRGVIRSGEVMALVVPQISSQVRSAGLSDPGLRNLYAAIYAAFRRRRSLLLLDLQSQVRLEELPWVAAIDTFRAEDEDGRRTADQVLEQLAVLTVTSFPQTILPNKLIQEFRALALAAGRELPLTGELAADIFMGDFSAVFVDAAKVAARMLGGSLYARYYDIPVDRVLQIDDFAKPTRYASSVSAKFAALCLERASIVDRDTWSVAQNGTIIEQQQILTTHNLAVPFDALALKDKLGEPLSDIAWRCFDWICRRQGISVADWRAQLQSIKNCAYAWRQMLFFLSLADSDQVTDFVNAARGHLSSQSAEVRRRLEPAVLGLAFVAGGGEFGAAGSAPGGGRRFLGWTTGRHWMFEEQRAPGQSG